MSSLDDTNVDNLTNQELHDQYLELTAKNIPVTDSTRNILIKKIHGNLRTPESQRKTKSVESLSELDDLETLTNKELRAKCLQYGLPDVPVTDSIRNILIRKLRGAIEGKPVAKTATAKKSPAPIRKSQVEVREANNNNKTRINSDPSPNRNRKNTTTTTTTAAATTTQHGGKNVAENKNKNKPTTPKANRRLTTTTVISKEMPMDLEHPAYNNHNIVENNRFNGNVFHHEIPTKIVSAATGPQAPLKRQLSLSKSGVVTTSFTTEIAPTYEQVEEDVEDMDVDYDSAPLEPTIDFDNLRFDTTGHSSDKPVNGVSPFSNSLSFDGNLYNNNITTSPQYAPYKAPEPYKPAYRLPSRDNVTEPETYKNIDSYRLPDTFKVPDPPRNRYAAPDTDYDTIPFNFSDEWRSSLSSTRAENEYRPIEEPCVRRSFYVCGKNQSQNEPVVELEPEPIRKTINGPRVSNLGYGGSSSTAYSSNLGTDINNSSNTNAAKIQPSNPPTLSGNYPATNLSSNRYTTTSGFNTTPTNVAQNKRYTTTAAASLNTRLGVQPPSPPPTTRRRVTTTAISSTSSPLNKPSLYPKLNEFYDEPNTQSEDSEQGGESSEIEDGEIIEGQQQQSQNRRQYAFDQYGRTFEMKNQNRKTLASPKERGASLSKYSMQGKLHGRRPLKADLADLSFGERLRQHWNYLDETYYIKTILFLILSFIVFAFIYVFFIQSVE